MSIDYTDHLEILHRTLNTHKREIRVVALHSSREHDDPVVCDLHTKSLNAKVEFEALSYVWGDQQHTTAIQVNGFLFQAAKNLEEALRRLRHPERQRILWIDAICIDQTDNEERTQQVGLMGEIYSQAQQVLVWLGHHDGASRQAIAFIEAAALDAKAHWKFDMSPHLPHQVLDTLHTSATASLLQRPWFTRVWTVQECVLASSLTFLIGDSSISGDTLWSFEQNYRWHVNTCGCIDYTIDFSLVSSMSATSNMAELRNEGARNRMCFSRMLRLFQSRQCSDARDRVYGLLGMATGKWRDVLVPNYERSAGEVFEEYFVECVKRTGELKELSYVFHNSDSEEVPRLPSWVPTWSPPENSEEDAWFQVRELFLPLYNAGIGLELSFIRPEPGVAIIKGILLDVIESVAPAPILDSPNLDTSIYIEWYDLAESAVLQHDRYGSSDTEAVFHRIICNSRMEQNTAEGKLESLRFSGSDFLPVFQKWFDIVKEELNGKGEASADIDARLDREGIMYHTTVIGSTIGRGFCVSKTGYLGLATKHARKGDVLMVLGGARVPHVLRPTSMFDGAGRMIYKFVGDAYVEGVMDGEAIGDIDVSSDQLEDFVLM
ncbi:Putative heterokaryon incompatibility [Septoria linicola]|uniref:Heterokaryon incompatibility n=1 Tax=Septoria linicola TaxID=215465 RepID=A0A9Q9AQY1_9PEZI|nr:putative heterokaryon incompatibility [Septoria linicola]USW50935.1 Putative heterokaryon incompatibility [Septoria linicola]